MKESTPMLDTVNTHNPKVREKTIESYLIEQCKAHGFMTLKFISSLTGVPDRIVIGAGRTVFVELKRPKGNDLSERQKIVIDKMRAAGAQVEIIRTLSQVDQLMATMADSANTQPKHKND